MALKKGYHLGTIEAGTDEAGRGCLAGPVVAAAVILNEDFDHPLLNDSKQLTAKQRVEIRHYIEQHVTAYAVAFVTEKEIDSINILQASIEAMHRAIAQLKVEPEHIIVDGNRFTPYKNIPHTTIVKGDATFMSIAAASVLAKTYRDDYMECLSKKYPHYGWEKNKGYPTQQHRNAIIAHGITEHHRTSFRLLPDQLTLDL